MTSSSGPKIMGWYLWPGLRARSSRQREIPSSMHPKHSGCCRLADFCSAL